MNFQALFLDDAHKFSSSFLGDDVHEFSSTILDDAHNFQALFSRR